jgi:hypothetical protein
MEIFRYSPVTYCLQCGSKKYSRYCKCSNLPVKIGKARPVDIEFFKLKKKLMREEYGSREKPKRKENQEQRSEARPRKRK